MYVMSLDISAGSTCVGVGNLLPVTLAWEPDESLDEGCLKLLSAAGSPVKVWEDQTKSNLLIDSGGGSHSAPPASFPTTVYVEGMSAGLATLFLDFTCERRNQDAAPGRRNGGV